MEKLTPEGLESFTLPLDFGADLRQKKPNPALDPEMFDEF